MTKGKQDLDQFSALMTSRDKATKERLKQLGPSHPRIHILDHSPEKSGGASPGFKK